MYSIYEVLLYFQLWLYFENFFRFTWINKYFKFEENNHPRIWRGWKKPLSLDMNFHKANLRSILPGPKVLSSKKFPNIGSGTLPQVCLFHIELDVDFPLWNNFKLPLSDILDKMFFTTQKLLKRSNVILHETWQRAVLKNSCCMNYNKLCSGFLLVFIVWTNFIFNDFFTFTRQICSWCSYCYWYFWSCYFRTWGRCCCWCRGCRTSWYCWTWLRRVWISCWSNWRYWSLGRSCYCWYSSWSRSLEVHFGPSVLRAPAEQTKVATVLGN